MINPFIWFRDQRDEITGLRESNQRLRERNNELNNQVWSYSVKIGAMQREYIMQENHPPECCAANLQRARALEEVNKVLGTQLADREEKLANARTIITAYQ